MQNSSDKRESLGKFASIVGILFNLILAGAKILVGTLFGALSILADGLNNLTDCGSSLMSFVSFKLSNKPADKEHPFGHERIEYILSMVVAFIILIIAFELFKESITKIFSPSPLEFSYLLIIVLVASILVKLGLFLFNKKMSVKINSDILKATSIDCLSDCISTLTVLIAMVVGKLTSFNFDGYAGIFVGIFITISGVGILKETMSKLIGQAPEQEIVELIKEKVLAYEGVCGIHDLNVYSYGPNKFFASIHIEVDASVDVMLSHELVDTIEQDFALSTNIMLTGHLDPIAINDPEVKTLRVKISSFLTEINPEFTLHDFRMVKGPNFTNLIFDIAVPYETKLTDEQVLELLKEKVQTLNGTYNIVAKVEKQTL